MMNINTQFILFAFEKLHSNDQCIIQMCHYIRNHFKHGSNYNQTLRFFTKVTGVWNQNGGRNEEETKVTN